MEKNWLKSNQIKSNHRLENEDREQSLSESSSSSSSSPVTSDSRVHYRKVNRLAQDVVAAAKAGPVGVART
jgi:hypothetical protein